MNETPCFRQAQFGAPAGAEHESPVPIGVCGPADVVKRRPASLRRTPLPTSSEGRPGGIRRSAPARPLKGRRCQLPAVSTVLDVAKPTRVAEWRKHRGFTQEALHHRSGVPMRTLVRIERGEHSTPPNLRHLVQLAYALGVPLDALLEPEWVQWRPTPKYEAPPEPRPYWARAWRSVIADATPVPDNEHAYG